MVLEEARRRISGAVKEMCNNKILGDGAVEKCMYEISAAMLQADVSIPVVKEMERRIMTKCKRYEKKIIQQAIFDEMCVVLDWGKPTFIPTKGDPSIVLVVGLRGSGKTTTCVKYARYHREMGYSPALVCADTFRAYKQLKQSAWSAGVPCYGSYIDWDPARIARQEIEWCRKDGHDLIIVDTSGRHEQEGALFEGMRRLVEATKPHLVILVVDSRIGQTALDQAAAFKRNLGVRRGAVILTHLDGHPKGVGALSAVASAKSPVVFVGTGEHVDDFEVFDAKPFVSSRLMGMAGAESVEVVPANPLVGNPQDLLFTLDKLFASFIRDTAWTDSGSDGFYLLGSKLLCHPFFERNLREGFIEGPEHLPKVDPLEATWRVDNLSTVLGRRYADGWKLGSSCDERLQTVSLKYVEEWHYYSGAEYSLVTTRLEGDETPSFFHTRKECMALSFLWMSAGYLAALFLRQNFLYPF